MSFNPSYARLGVGFAISAVLLYAFVNMGAAKASGAGEIRYINIEGATFRVKRMGQGVFEIACWGVGIVFIEEPGPPLATYVFGQAGPISANGNPDIIDLIQRDVGKFPTNLFSPEMAKCSRPGC